MKTCLLENCGLLCFINHFQLFKTYAFKTIISHFWGSSMLDSSIDHVYIKICRIHNSVQYTTKKKINTNIYDFKA